MGARGSGEGGSSAPVTDEPARLRGFEQSQREGPTRMTSASDFSRWSGCFLEVGNARDLGWERGVRCSLSRVVDAHWMGSRSS